MLYANIIPPDGVLLGVCVILPVQIPPEATQQEKRRRAMSLTATAVKQAKAKEKPYKLSGGKGMFLLVNPNGSKYWRFKYRFGGKEKLLALGVYPDLSLSEANDKRDEARNHLAKDIDPGVAKRAKKHQQAQEGTNSFKVVATEWFETRMKDKAQGYQDRTWRG